jgi:hypothetical protein
LGWTSASITSYAGILQAVTVQVLDVPLALLADYAAVRSAYLIISRVFDRGQFVRTYRIESWGAVPFNQ